MYCTNCFKNDHDCEMIRVDILFGIDEPGTNKPKIDRKTICFTCFGDKDYLVDLVTGTHCLKCGKFAKFSLNQEWCFYSELPYKIVYMCCSKSCRDLTINELKDIGCESLTLNNPINLIQIISS